MNQKNLPRTYTRIIKSACLQTFTTILLCCLIICEFEVILTRLDSWFTPACTVIPPYLALGQSEHSFTLELALTSGQIANSPDSFLHKCMYIYYCLVNFLGRLILCHLIDSYIGSLGGKNKKTYVGGSLLLPGEWSASG